MGSLILPSDLKADATLHPLFLKLYSMQEPFYYWLASKFNLGNTIMFDVHQALDFCWLEMLDGGVRILSFLGLAAALHPLWAIIDS